MKIPIKWDYLCSVVELGLCSRFRIKFETANNTYKKVSGAILNF